MEKKMFAGLAKLVGFKINEDDIEEIEAVADPEALAKDSEPESEKPEAAKANAKVDEEPKSEPESKPVVKNSSGDDAEWFKTFINDIGGREAFQGLMINAVKAIETLQNTEKAEKDTVIASLVANTNGQFTEEELNQMELPVLRKMAAVMVPQNYVNYALLGGGNVHKNEDIAVMPDIFSKEAWAKEN